MCVREEREIFAQKESTDFTDIINLYNILIELTTKHFFFLQNLITTNSQLIKSVSYRYIVSKGKLENDTEFAT